MGIFPNSGTSILYIGGYGAEEEENRRIYLYFYTRIAAILIDLLRRGF
jgi:hypothetical protein